MKRGKLGQIMIKFLQKILDKIRQWRIPKGMYCYKYSVDESTGLGLPVIKVCPYWSMREDKPSQDNGYCSYLKMGDWEDEEHIGLLWDQVRVWNKR